jgi:hypothetical protein
VFEMPEYQVRQDTQRWRDLLQWLARDSYGSSCANADPVADNGLTTVNG